MKKPFCLLLTAVLLGFLFPRILPTGRAEESELTILAYICGSDLESRSGEASADIREMVSSGIGNIGEVTVLLATGGASQWNGYDISSRNVQYYRLEKNGPALLKDAGRMSMGDAKTLSSFLSFSLSAAPAKRYIMV